MTTAESAPSTAQIRIEDLFDLAEIGRGAAATVYRCTRPDGGAAAVKLYQAVAADDAAAEQFRRESGALGRLPRHPAIIALEGRGRAGDGRPFLLLELTETSLRSLVDEDGPRPWPEATTMAITLAGALETAHRAGVVHCDIAPANVHRVDGDWKLADFGAACAGPDDGDEARPFTLDHAAPEAIRGEPGAVGRDVYGLASTLFHALAGEAPFGEVRSTSTEDIAQRIAREPAPDLRPAGVPDALCRVVERALSKDPDLRPTTAAGLARELSSAAESLGLRVLPPLVLAPATADLTAAPSTPDRAGPGPAAEAPPVPLRPPSRFAPMLVGVAAAALAVGAAIPVVSDAIDDGPDSLVLADQPAEVARGAGDADEAEDDTAADQVDPEATEDGDGGVAAVAADAGGGGGNGGGAVNAAAPSGDGAPPPPAAPAAGGAGGDGNGGGGNGGGGNGGGGDGNGGGGGGNGGDGNGGGGGGGNNGGGPGN